MIIKRLMVGMFLAILILTTIGSAETGVGSTFFTLWGHVFENGTGVNGATVTLTINGVTKTTVTATNNRGEAGVYIFDLANFPNAVAGTSMNLSAASATKTTGGISTVTRGPSEPQQVDLLLTTAILDVTPTTSKPGAKPTSKAIQGFELVAALAALSALYMLWRKR